MLSKYDLDHKGSNMNDDSEFSRGASVLALTRRRYRPQARRFVRRVLLAQCRDRRSTATTVFSKGVRTWRLVQ
jgi:hypothetical protein